MPKTQKLASAAFLVILLWGISAAQPFLVPVCFSALLAFLMAPMVRYLRRFHVPEWAALSLSAIVLLLPFAALCYGIFEQSQKLIRDFPRIVAQLDALITRAAQTSLANKLGWSGGTNLSSLFERLASRAADGIRVVMAGLGALLNAGSQTILILLFAILMTASRMHLRRSGERILAKYEALQGPAMLDEVTRLIERFLIARLLIVLLVGAADAAILVGFSIPYTLLMGAFLGLMTLVPVVGFIVGVIPPIVVSLALKNSFPVTVLLFCALFVMSIVEGNVLTPTMVGRSLNLNALFTFLGLLAGSLLWGIGGMFLAIPILAILRIAFAASPQLWPWAALLSEKSDKPASPEIPQIHRRAGSA